MSKALNISGTLPLLALVYFGATFFLQDPVRFLIGKLGILILGPALLWNIWRSRRPGADDFRYKLAITFLAVIVSLIVFSNMVDIVQALFQSH